MPQSAANSEKTVSTGKYALHMGITRTTALNYAKTGKVRAFRSPESGCWRIFSSELEKLGPVPTRKVSPVLLVDDVVDYLRVSRKTVYSFIKDGRLKASQIGGVGPWRFLQADVDSFLVSLHQEGSS